MEGKLPEDARTAMGCIACAGHEHMLVLPHMFIMNFRADSRWHQDGNCHTVLCQQ